MLLRRQPHAEAATIDCTTQLSESHESAAIAEALAIIDRGLISMAHRSIVSADEVVDLLLDVRVALLAAQPVTDPSSPLEPVDWPDLEDGVGLVHIPG